ncbi:MAG: FeoA family protein [Candidatus Omnitrophica bacterium]|nr:FeoA family protein [Candidatus Omnitrophota bacterium]
MKDKTVDLNALPSGSSGIVREVKGGRETVLKLESLGIRPGKKITKLSSHFWRGPVTIKVDKSKVAIGHGLAQKVFIEV